MCAPWIGVTAYGQSFEVASIKSESERFALAAKVPESASKEEMPAMLQHLLAERSKLKLRRESKAERVSSEN